MSGATVTVRDLAPEELGLVGNLETDKAVNVGWYQRFGFEVTDENTVLGVPCWYQRRPAA